MPDPTLNQRKGRYAASSQFYGQREEDVCDVQELPSDLLHDYPIVLSIEDLL